MPFCRMNGGRSAPLISRGRLAACTLLVLGLWTTTGSVACALQQDDESERERNTKTHSGQVVRVLEDQLEMSTEGERDSHRHRITDDTEVTLDGEEARLKDLKPGDRIRVTTPKDDPKVALRIEATRPERRQRERSRFQPPRRGLLDTLLGRHHSGLGVLVEPPRGEEEGVVVIEVYDDSPAEEAGVRRGDVILSLDDETIGSPAQLAQVVGGRQPGERVKIQLRRAGEKKEISAKLRQREEIRGLEDLEEQIPQLSRRLRRQWEQPQGYRSEPSAWMGVRMGEAEEEEEGVAIQRVFPGSPAARAGISVGDILTKINGERVSDPQEALEILDRCEPNQEVQLTLKRDDEQLNRKLRLADRREFFGSQAFRRGLTPDESDMDDNDDVPEEAMMLEFQRHLGQQLERLQRMVGELTEEVQQMRKQLDDAGVQRRQPSDPQRSRPQSQPRQPNRDHPLF